MAFGYELQLTGGQCSSLPLTSVYQNQALPNASGVSAWGVGRPARAEPSRSAQLLSSWLLVLVAGVIMLLALLAYRRHAVFMARMAQAVGALASTSTNAAPTAAAVKL